MVSQAFYKPARAGFGCVVALFCLMIALSGCGNNQADVGSSTPPPPSAGQQNVVAPGPAPAEPLEFEKLALDSPIKRVKINNGPTYLEFSYTDKDGKLYKCRLPEVMAKGKYKPDEWVRTFNIYRLPTVLKQKAVAKKKSSAEVTDFPFISPRAPSQSEQSQQPDSSKQPLDPMGPR